MKVKPLFSINTINECMYDKCMCCWRSIKRNFSNRNEGMFLNLAKNKLRREILRIQSYRFVIILSHFLDIVVAQRTQISIRAYNFQCRIKHPTSSWSLMMQPSFLSSFSESAAIFSPLWRAIYWLLIYSRKQELHKVRLHPSAFFLWPKSWLFIWNDTACPKLSIITKQDISKPCFDA